MDKDRPYTVACISAFEKEASIARVILAAKKHVDKAGVLVKIRLNARG